jgi:hypothetical protein
MPARCITRDTPRQATTPDGTSLATRPSASLAPLLDWLSSPQLALVAPPNEELKLPALASEAAGSLRSPAALLMVRRS